MFIPTTNAHPMPMLAVTPIVEARPLAADAITTVPKAC